MSESDEDLINALEESTDPKESPVATPDDVADDLDISGEAVRQRLLKLAADGDAVATRKLGRSRVFWLLPVESPGDDREIGRAPDTRDVKDIVADEECLSCGWSPAAVILTKDGWECYNCGHDPDEEPSVPEVEPRDHAGDVEAEAFDSVDELVGNVDPSDTGDDDLRAEVLEQLEDSDVQARTAREALVSLAEVLDERGITKTAELRAAVYDRHQDDYSSEKAMWASIQPFMADFEYIEDPGRGEWAPSRPRK